MTLQGKIRVIIVDDIAETRENIRKLLQFESDVEVIGVARTGREAIDLSKEAKPDVVLMDINMPDMDGITATEAIWGRGEVLGNQPEHRGTRNWAVSRALSSSADVARLASPFLAAGGHILLYKGDPDSEELRSLDLFCKELHATWTMQRIAVPHLREVRSLIVVDLAS